MLRATITLTAFLAAAPLAAQSNPLVGKWDIDFPGGARIENGEVTTLMAKGTLEIVVQGDSLIATLNVIPSAEIGARPPSRLAARRTDGEATFVQKSQARMNVNGEESVHEITTTWALHAAGDALEGTLARSGAMEMMGGAVPPQPVKGTRAK